MRRAPRGDAGTVEQILDATLEEIYQALKRGESISLRSFGTFYVREERSSWVFRFNPSQKWQALFDGREKTRSAA